MTPRSLRALVAGAAVLASTAAGCSGAVSDDDASDPGATDEGALREGWSSVGSGVAYRATGAGHGVFIGYAGYSVPLDRSSAWVDALSDARLGELGVGHLYAVRGPTDPGYAARDVGNTKLAAHLVGGAARAAPFVLVAAHSSGSYVAHELLGQVFEGSLDPDRLLEGKVVYANLDGGQSGLDAGIVRALRRVAFVWAEDTTLSQGRSANAAGMEALGQANHGAGIRLVVDRSGCRSGAKWCLHDLLITTRPHDPNTFDLVRDYTDFAGRRVQDGWIRALESALR